MTNVKRVFMLLCALLCASVAVAQTAPTTLFQLDGQGAQNPNWQQCTYVDKGSSTSPQGTIAAACDYWNLLNGSGGANIGPISGTSANHFNAFTFIDGSLFPLSFTGAGGEKDTQDPSTWTWGRLPSPDKDTLNNGYVAAYTGTAGPGGVSNGHLVLVFGADRNSVNGDANIGIWFFQLDVHPLPVPNGSNSGVFVLGNNTKATNPEHKNGDIFVSSAFTGGGAIPDIAVYMWDTSCTGTASGFDVKHPDADAPGVCADKNIRFLYAQSNICLSGVLPGGTISQAPVCAVTNNAPAQVSWSSPIKTGGTVLPAQTLFMGGIDLSYIFNKNFPGVPVPCFAGFLMTTRTSQTIGSTAKDFLTGSFPTCSVQISKACQCDTILNNGIPTGGNATSSYEYQVSGFVKNDGFGDLYRVTVTDTDKGLNFKCDTLAAGTSKKWGATAGTGDCTPDPGNPTCVNVPSGSCYSTTNKPDTNTAHVASNTAPDGSGTVVSKDTSPITNCPADATIAPFCNPSPAMTPFKECTVDLALKGGMVAIKVNYDGNVVNSATSGEAVTHVNVSEDDNNDGNADVPSLALTKIAANGNNLGACGTPCNLLPGQSVTFSGSYFPDTFTALGPLQGRASFTDKITATATNPANGQTLTQTYTATCVVCPAGSCPAQ